MYRYKWPTANLRNHSSPTPSAPFQGRPWRQKGNGVVYIKTSFAFNELVDALLDENQNVDGPKDPE
jgi:hypothetical protein